MESPQPSHPTRAVNLLAQKARTSLTPDQFMSGSPFRSPRLAHLVALVFTKLMATSTYKAPLLLEARWQNHINS